MDLEKKYEDVIQSDQGHYESSSQKSERMTGRSIAFVGLCIVESAKIIADAMTKQNMPQAKRPPVLEDRLIDRE